MDSHLTSKVQTLVEKLFNSMIELKYPSAPSDKNIHETISKEYTEVSKTNFSHNIYTFQLHFGVN